MLKESVENRTIKNIILNGVSQDKKYSEIAKELGISIWTVKKEVIKMRYNNDPKLIAAKKSKKRVQKEKLKKKRTKMKYFKQNKEFLKLTGLTLKEKTFRNMVEFYQEELLNALKSSDQGTIISNFPKNIKNTLKKNDIITDTSHSKELTLKAERYLKVITPKK
jgi:hypothetical protein